MSLHSALLLHPALTTQCDPHPVSIMNLSALSSLRLSAQPMFTPITLPLHVFHMLWPVLSVAFPLIVISFCHHLWCHCATKCGIIPLHSASCKPNLPSWVHMTVTLSQCHPRCSPSTFQPSHAPTGRISLPFAPQCDALCLQVDEPGSYRFQA